MKVITIAIRPIANTTPDAPSACLEESIEATEFTALSACLVLLSSPRPTRHEAPPTPRVSESMLGQWQQLWLLYPRLHLSRRSMLAAWFPIPGAFDPLRSDARNGIAHCGAIEPTAAQQVTGESTSY
jgi:hypothetical protein